MRPMSVDACVAWLVGPACKTLVIIRKTMRVLSEPEGRRAAGHPFLEHAADIAL